MRKSHHPDPIVCAGVLGITTLLFLSKLVRTYLWAWSDIIILTTPSTGKNIYQRKTFLKLCSIQYLRKVGIRKVTSLGDWGKHPIYDYLLSLNLVSYQIEIWLSKSSWIGRGPYFKSIQKVILFIPPGSYTCSVNIYLCPGKSTYTKYKPWKFWEWKKDLDKV